MPCRAGATLVAAAVALAACGGAARTSPLYPPRPDGCAIQVFEDSPPMPTTNLGTVRSSCASDIGHDACLRELKDQACRLGADVVWGVADAPRIVDDRSWFSGRAAHTK